MSSKLCKFTTLVVLKANCTFSATGATGSQGPIGLTGAAGATGATGPQGPIGLTGATGPVGLQGIQGVAGTNGAAVLNGTTAPSTLIGVNGDFYINTNTNTLYGPKAAGIWPTGTSLIGAAGLTGATGSQGATGPQGSQGATGPQGAQGTTGATGAQGPIGLTGPQGPSGTNGANGISAYQAWLNLGNTGSESVFIASLTGPAGAAGATGAQGVAGLGYQSLGINSIPASLNIATFLTNNNWRDAYIIVPTEYDQWNIIDLSASYGDSWPSSANDFRIEIRDTTNSVAGWYDYSHQANVRHEVSPTLNQSGSVTLMAGYTINVLCAAGAPVGGDAEGYTVTIKIQ